VISIGNSVRRLAIADDGSAVTVMVVRALVLPMCVRLRRLVSDATIDAEEKYEWLRDYIQTYLQRDVRDLANLRDLEPFVRAQQALAGMGGQLLNASALARLAGVGRGVCGTGDQNGRARGTDGRASPAQVG